MKRLFVNRGRRVRLSDCHLIWTWKGIMMIPFFLLLIVYHFFITYPYFVKLKSDGTWKNYILPVFVTVVVVVLALVISSFVVRKSEDRDGFFKRKKKIQMLARYMNSNNLVEVRQSKSKEGKDKFYLPKTYYKSDKDIDTFTFETGNKFHNAVITIGKPLSEMFLSDLTAIRWEMGFISYDFLSGNQSKRLMFSDVTAKDGKIMLMNGVSWEYDKLPHMLIIGGTGGGKTYFIYSLIYALSTEGRVHCADPKMADLAEFANFKAFKDLVVHEKDDIVSQMQEAVELMDKRYLYMKRLKNYTIGKNYRYYGMKPEFFIIDELSAFVSTLSGREYEIFFSYVIPLVLKARQAGIYLIFATQRPDTQTLPGSVRDNLLCRVSLGKLSPTGYDMGFPDSKDKAFVNKDIVGRGYIDIGTGIPIEFYSPFVPKDFDFVEHFKNLTEMPFTDVSDVELTVEAKEEVEDLYDLIDDFEEEEIENSKAEVLTEEKEEKDKKIDDLMEAAGVPSYREQLVKERENDILH